MDLLRRMRGEGIAPTTPVFNAAIKACSKGGKLKLALALLDDMRAYGAPPVVDVAGPDSFRPRGKCGNSRPDDEAEAKTDLLREVQRGWRGGGGGVGTEDRSSAPDIQTFNTVMSACGRAGQWELALEMMRQAREQWGLRLTRVTYTTAIAACGRSRQAKRAVELLTEMREAGLVPDAISFNSAIAGYARTGRWKKALSLLREMESSQGAGGTEVDGAATIRIPSDEFSYSSKIAACGKGGKWSLAVGLLDTMRRTGIRQCTVPYNAAIKACGEAGQWERALELLREMQAVQTGGRTHTAQADGSAPPAERLAAMAATVPFPDTVSYNAAIKACGDAGEWVLAVALLEEMRRRNSANKTCAEGTSGFEGEHLGGRCDAALQVGIAGPNGEAVGSGEAGWSPSRLRPSPDATSYSMAVSACTRAGKADEALGLLEVMQQDSFSPDSVTFASAISVCGRGRGRAHAEVPRALLLLVALIDRMRSSTVPSSAPCYARALEACADAGLCERGRFLMDDIVAAKVGVKKKALNAVARACACVPRSFRQAPTVQLVSKFMFCKTSLA